MTDLPGPVLVELCPDRSPAQLRVLTDTLARLGLEYRLDDESRPMRAAVFSCSAVQSQEMAALSGVSRLESPRGACFLGSRAFAGGKPRAVSVTMPDGSVRSFGEKAVPIIAGPCAVESRDITLSIAAAVRNAGLAFFRGGAFKARTSPYAFQGLGQEGLHLLAEVRRTFGLAIVTEVLTVAEVPEVAEVADIVQVGTRNMANVNLLKALGKIDRPVLLKRGMSATIEEFLAAAEYILAGGNQRVILCERGIRTFEPSTRFTIDISAIPAIKQRSHLPIIIDPSHATGDPVLVEPVSLAGIAAGADGLMLEAHEDPTAALSDSSQALPVKALPALLTRLSAVALAVGRTLSPAHEA